MCERFYVIFLKYSREELVDRVNMVILTELMRECIVLRCALMTITSVKK